MAARAELLLLTICTSRPITFEAAGCRGHLRGCDQQLATNPMHKPRCPRVLVFMNDFIARRFWRRLAHA
jgi:hypothetical protein